MINYIDIAVAVLYLLFSYVGYKRGMLMSVLGLVRYIVGLPLCYGISDKYSVNVYNSLVQPRALEYLDKRISSAKSVNDLSASLKDAFSYLPKSVKGNIDLSKFDFNSQELAQSILKKAFEPMLINATRAVLFMIAFVLFFGSTAILLGIISGARKKHRQQRGKGFLAKCDSALGLILGVAKYLIIAFVVASVAMQLLKDGIIPDGKFQTMLGDSYFVSVIDKINPFNRFIGG